MARGRVRTELVGDKELREKLHRMGDLVRQANSKAARAAEEPIVAEANSLAPGPHILALQSARESTEDLAVVDIAPDKEHWYYQFTETGAGEHEIKGNPLLAFEGDHGLVIIGKVTHPGMDAKPFLRPALMHNRDQAQKLAGEVFLREINKVTE